MSLKRALPFVAIALLAGCSCDEPAAPRETTATEPAPPPPGPSLASTSRADLPALTPMLTVEVTEETVHLSNVALVATWPDRDREALAGARPTGDARWPEVDETVDIHGDDLAVPTLREAFARAANVDHARASLAGASGAPIAFGLRAAPDVRFARILQAIYAAGLAGYAEPRLVLLGATSEVALALPLPRAEPARDRDVARDLGRALSAAGLGGTADLGGETEPVMAPASRSIAVVLASDGLHVARDGHALATGCATESDVDVGAIRQAELSPSVIDACLDAAGEGTLTFRTAVDTRWADAVAILETLAARGAVGLAVAR